MMSNLMKGTAILTLGMFLSKVLGLIYIFPFYAIVGEKNIALYQYAYIPYSIMLAIAISGAPIAVSKFVSKYNAMGDYQSGRKLMKSGILIMMMTGFAAFIALFFLATPIAGLVIKSEEQVFTVDQIASVIRWVSFALIVVPFMSLWRGFFQGYDKMEPTAVSQLVEQIVRIVVLLGGSFIVVVVFKGKPETAISFAVFAAFIGAIGGLGVLYYYWKKYQPEFNLLRSQSVTSTQLPMSNIYKEVITYSIPMVFVGVANPLFQLVDMLTFNGAMTSIGLAEVTDTYLSMINFMTHKVVIIPVMLATGFSMALVPTITKYYTQGEYLSLRHAMDKTYQILIFITLPAVVGISLLANEIYFMLYSESEMGSMILAHYAPVAILFALFQVTAALLQGIDFQKWIVFSLLSGIFVKLALNIPLIRLLEADGAIVATAIGYSVSIIINILVLRKTLNYRSEMVVRRVMLIALLTMAMAVSVLIVHKLLELLMGPVDSKFSALLFSVICAVVGVAVYGFLSLRIGLAQKLLGERLTRIMSKLGMK
ncbi:Membrane protein involved in the export of O-antigen and teichoic acid [Lysinibacillus fusiformis]|uniref:Membrane protein involved in the export of O-antigen and teichoic acid n=2 Tax=Bacillaceae TaxID=186817 RepID=A0A1H9G4D5_9BACI|nr:cell division protein [Lysinibacillus fusiformis]KHK57024.1 cell division protein [Lysinibacillus sp. A1]KGA81593.1 cell division protein [Lysinibacillus fusiformis]SCX68610.1 Membrane protein involved in the export of O-antigen and teichoic acid [Lysinibacillus fusiformis]SCY18255.1 Membrane protein involved in the export of O-antigen and teichoic acid [Lysinibacillus fusiformis]